MARTAIALVTPIGPYPTLPVAANSADFVFTALTGSSGSNGNQIAFGNFNRLLVLVQNTDGANPYTVTLSSLASSNTFNRTGDIGAYTLQAAEFAGFFVERQGFYQSDGNLYLEGNNAAIKVAAIGVL